MSLKLALHALLVVGLFAIAPVKVFGQSGRVFYVDFDAGADTASGLSPTKAWRHAPGDPMATNLPKAAALAPGDTVQFRGGVTYRGYIDIRASGGSSRPITYSGTGWGTGMAKISGRDSFNIVALPCSASPICAGLPHADQLVVIDLPSPANTYSQIVFDGHILHLAQYPRPPDAAPFDDIGSFAAVPADRLSRSLDGLTWRIDTDVVKKAIGSDAAGDLSVLLWGYPGVVTSAPVSNYDPGTGAIQFQSSEFKLSKQALMQFALVNHPRFLTLPYDFATAARGTKLVVRALSTSTQLEISKRQWGFTSINQKNVVVKGFEIEGFADGPKGGGGGAIQVRGVSNFDFNGNNLHDLESWGGAGAVTAMSATDFSVENNHFKNLPHGSGMRITGSSGVHVSGNTLETIGRTGIYFQGSQNSLIDHNVLRHLYGSHGNGISVYLANQNVTVSNNQVTEATRAVTFEGSNHPELSNNLVFRANLLKGREGVGLQSWGANTNGVTIEQNIILIDGGIQALRLSGRDSNVSVRRNIIDGYQGYPLPLPPDTSLTGNIFVSDSRGSTSGNEIQSDLRKSADSLFDETTKPDPKICAFLVGSGNPTAGIGPHDLCRTQ